MPLYEYSCPTHGEFEVTQSIKEDPLKHCPKCAEEGKETEVKKLISLGNFVLTGNCWASNGYSK